MNHVAMIKESSGIEGLDNILSGGFPKGRAYLISGEPGTGKTIFSMQYLLSGIRQGQKAIYISIDEKPEHVILDCELLGWNIRKYLENGMLQILDVTSYFGTSKLEVEDGIQIEKIVKDILGFVKKSGATRMAIDPIAPLVLSDKNVPFIAEYIRKLIFEIEAINNCTTLLTSYVPVGSEKVSQHGIEEFAASGIILLRLVKTANQYVRSIWVRKMRGTRIDLTEYTFEILQDRGLVLRHPL